MLDCRVTTTSDFAIFSSLKVKRQPNTSAFGKLIRCTKMSELGSFIGDQLSLVLQPSMLNRHYPYAGSNRFP